jgi:hypothetical protein
MDKGELESLLAAPALDAPAGVTADFDDPPNGNHLAWFVTTFSLAISTTCLLVRAYARCWKKKKIHKEEGAYNPLEPSWTA